MESVKIINEDNKFINILVCTSRISLSKMLIEGLGLKLYSDVQNGQHKLNSIYSLKSLNNLTENLQYYNEEEAEENRYIEGEDNNDDLKVGKNHELILIIDQRASYLNHFESSTVKEKKQTKKNIFKIIEKSK